MNSKHQQTDWRFWLAGLLNSPPRILEFPAEVEFAALLSSAEFEGVIPLLYRQVQMHELKERLPHELLEKLKALHLNYVATQLTRQHELANLLQLFRQNDLTCIILKGEALSQTLYPAPFLRSRCDTDLLFTNRASAEKAWSILKDQGYQRDSAPSGEHSESQFSCMKELPGDLRVELDIHYEINNYTWFANRLTFDELLANSQVIEYPIGNGEAVPASVLTPAYNLLHCCIHRVTNKSTRTENRLIWLYDIHLFCGKLTNEEWQILTTLCQKKQLSRIILQGIDAAKTVFTTAMPESYYIKLAQQGEQEPEGISNLDRRLQLHLSNVLSTPGIRNKLRHLREKLLPSPDFIAQKYQLKNRASLPWYYFRRIIDVTFRR